MVHDTIGYAGPLRLYNAAWGMQVHLTAWQLTGDVEALRRFVQTVDAFDDDGGLDSYPIGLPIRWGLSQLASARLAEEEARIRDLFIAHADRIAENGRGFPEFEVSYEQSIVAPAVQILSETGIVTGDTRYVTAARRLLPLLEAFGGRQPHHRLHDIAVRHWDGFWFGKEMQLGDTMAHYWSTITAVAFAQLAAADPDAVGFTASPGPIGRDPRRKPVDVPSRRHSHLRPPDARHHRRLTGTVRRPLRQRPGLGPRALAPGRSREHLDGRVDLSEQRRRATPFRPLLHSAGWRSALAASAVAPRRHG